MNKPSFMAPGFGGITRGQSRRAAAGQSDIPTADVEYLDLIEARLQIMGRNDGEA
jgi:hypothetical protein